APLEGTPGPPLVSATLIPVIASRPSPQLMSYVNDSFLGRSEERRVGEVLLFGLSNQASINVARSANETVSPSEIDLSPCGAVTTGFWLASVTKNDLDFMPLLSSCRVPVTLYRPSSAYVCLALIAPLDGAPGPPFVSAMVIPAIASRPSPQSMSYVNDSFLG